MIQSPELQSKIALWKSRVLAGTITMEELQEAVIVLRQGRKSAVEAAGKAKRASSARPARSAEALLDELENL